MIAYSYIFVKEKQGLISIRSEKKHKLSLQSISKYTADENFQTYTDQNHAAQYLRFARQQVLTKRQQQMLELYYDQGLTMGQIAAKLHLNRSTVCRTLQRARERLYACLRYTL